MLDSEDQQLRLESVQSLGFRGVGPEDCLELHGYLKVTKWCYK